VRVRQLLAKVLREEFVQLYSLPVLEDLKVLRPSPTATGARGGVLNGLN
jgi:hypothetical protein